MTDIAVLVASQSDLSRPQAEAATGLLIDVRLAA